MCNSNKTVCVVCNPKRRHNIVAVQFPHFTFSFNKEQLSFVQEFEYLGHILTKRQLDDEDILRERKNLFYHCNMLTRRFNYCSIPVKLQLFKCFRICFYDAALWTILLLTQLTNLGLPM